MTTDGIASVLVAIVTTLGTVGAAFIAARSGKIPGLRKVEDAAVWKERAELADVKVENLTERLTAKEAELEEERERRIFAEREADAAVRRENAMYAELQRDGRLVDRRREPRSEDDR